MSRMLLVAVTMLALSGCVRASATSYRTLPPKASAEAVEVYSERLPERAFDEVGLIEVVGAEAASYVKLLKRAQQEGAKLGADAIIVSRRPIKSAAAVVNEVNGMTFASVQQGEAPRLWVVAIVWKDPAP